MARGKKKPQSNNFSTTFIKCELTSDDKKKFADWVKKPPMDFDSLMNEVVHANHKISISYSEHSDSYIVSCTGKPEECDNASKCYTSHAKDITTGLWVMLYKYHAIWKGEAWEAVGEEADFG